MAIKQREIPQAAAEKTNNAAAGKKEAKKPVDKVADAGIKEEKGVPKAPEKTEAVYLQYGDKEVEIQDVMDRVGEIWTKDMGNQPDDRKDTRVYIKPEDDTAYFVINGDIKGSFGL